MPSHYIQAYEKAKYELYKATKECIANGVEVFDRCCELPETHTSAAKFFKNRSSIIRDLGKQYHSPHVCEVGVFKGDFSAQLLNVLKPASLTLIDLSFESVTPENRCLLEESAVTRFITGDSSVTLGGFSKDFDIIYIDGDHSYDGVKKDIKSAKGALRPGGVLVFNDYTVWSPQACCSNGVARAVNEFIIDEGYEVTHFCLQSLFYNDIALKKIQSF
jgi:hypothetical protein